MTDTTIGQPGQLRAVPTPAVDIDAYEAKRAAAVSARAKAAARAAGVASGRAAKRGLLAGLRRVATGAARFPGDFLGYWNDVQGQYDIEESAPDKRAAAKETHHVTKLRHRATATGAAGSLLAWSSAGWTELHRLMPGDDGWAAVVSIWLILLIVAGVSARLVADGKSRGGWTWPVALWSIVATSFLALFVHAGLGLATRWMLAGTLLVVLVWLLVAGWDGALFEDAEEEAPVPIVADAPATGLDPASAALATKRLPADSTPVLVAPGVVWGNGGMIWTATLDTGGSSATVLLEAKAKAELAARLGLSSRRLVLTVDEDRGSRLHLTGIVGKPWRDDVRHPLMALEAVDLWAGIPWGVDLAGNVVHYRVEGVNGLFGGESGAGKSTAVAGVWAAFALAVHGGQAAQIYVADGGEVDTEPLHRSGLATAWTTELSEATEILRAVLAEVDRRQHLLAKDELRKVSPEFFARHGLGFVLLAVDELATFTQRKGKEADEFGETLRQIAQRARKTGVHLLLSTQSPSVDALDADARDVIPVRWCGRARSVDLAGKVLGKGAVGRGVDPRDLPDVRGVGWYSAPDREVVVRPYALTDDDLRAVCARGVELRKGARVASAADDDRILLASVVRLIKERGVTVGGRKVMRLRDVATCLEMDQMALRNTLAEQGVRTQIVRRTDSPADDNRAHYVLDDFPSSLAALL